MGYACGMRSRDQKFDSPHPHVVKLEHYFFLNKNHHGCN